MRRQLRSIAVPATLVAVLVPTLAGCSGDRPSADKCQTVSVPLVDVPTRTDQEPKLRVPAPPGWERTTQMDSEQIRLALRNKSLTADNFSPNAVVTLQKLSSAVGRPEQILKAQNDQIAKKLKVTDMSSTPAEVCGSPAMSTTYTAPEMKVAPKIPPVPARRATSLGVVYRDGEVTYVAILTVQTVKPDDKRFIEDSATILEGFQVLPAA